MKRLLFSYTCFYSTARSLIHAVSHDNSTEGIQSQEVVFVKESAELLRSQRDERTDGGVEKMLRGENAVCGVK